MDELRESIRKNIPVSDKTMIDSLLNQPTMLVPEMHLSFHRIYLVFLLLCATPAISQ